MLCHRNFCANILEAWKAYKVNKRDVFMSILPIAHTYEMSIGMLYPFAMGSKVCYLQKMPTPTVLVSSLKKVRPTVMLSVPLIIEKMYRNSVVPTIEKSKFLQYLQKNIPWLLYLLVGTKLKKTFGGRIGFFGIGGAKVDPTVEAFLKKVRFPYAIGYGLTETAPLICNASPFKTAVGSTGIAAYGVQIKLENVNPETGVGELVVKGDNVMLGYYKDYNRTKEVLSKDGWFHSGDLAAVDKKGKYYIKGRMGTVIIGASGENIYPEEIENVINNIEDITESLVVQRSGNLVALVRFNENIIDWDLEGQDKFIDDLEAKKKAILEMVNSKVSRFSKINSVEIPSDVPRQPVYVTGLYRSEVAGNNHAPAFIPRASSISPAEIIEYFKVDQFFGGNVHHSPDHIYHTVIVNNQPVKVLKTQYLLKILAESVL
jgi:long-chain acyl-CoA synthetase